MKGVVTVCLLSSAEFNIQEHSSSSLHIIKVNYDVPCRSWDIFTLCRKSTPLMHLIFSFLQADPDILTMRTVLRLFDLNDEIQRHKTENTIKRRPSVGNFQGSTFASYFISNMLAVSILPCQEAAGGQL
ncbi:hypothetical protein T11_14643 [Trichinella zimbabwensis]|uniref:Uncharacterized protein n=1 Tax=Trichinella zimbabwensis TaxID=268475 RepID=A0A0V1HV31_9BILA|nr:hypothetical protein T11_14643 [Trichinella zimbabwensis]